MNSSAIAASTAAAGRPRLDSKPGMGTVLLFLLLLVGGLAYTVLSLSSDVSDSAVVKGSARPT